jgi:hypothetical protein
MPIKVTCSNCGGVLHAPDDAGGKRGRCPTCGNILPIPADAARSSVGALPDPPLPKAGRAPSFGDFAVGPPVGAPPGGPPESIPIGQVTSPMPSPAARAASVPAIGDPRKASALPPPPAKPEPRRAADPFARKGTAAGGGDWQPAASPGEAKGWRKAKSGLWWVGAAAFLFLIPALGLPGLVVAEHFAKKPLLPDAEFPGLKMNQQVAIPLLAAVAPILLGLICLALGRLGFSGAPKRSFVGGPALLSALATLVMLGGGFAVVMPAAALLINGETIPLQFMPHDDPSGMIQRFGALAAVAGLMLGEFWFASAVGRAGTALSDGATAGRSTRWLFLFGMAVAFVVVSAAVMPTAFGFGASAREHADEVGRLVTRAWNDHVSPQLDRLGEYRPLLKPGAFLVGGLFVGLIYFRLVSAPRRAIREWLDKNST